MRKKIICGLLTMTMVFNVMSYPVMAKDEEKEKTGGELLENIYVSQKRQDVKVQEDNEMEQEACKKGKYLECVMGSSKEYMEEYGGTYINEQGELVVLLTETTEKTRLICENAVGSEGVVYEECEVSINELDILKEEILAFCEDNRYSDDIVLSNLVDSIVSVGTYVDDNTVYVEMIDCCDDKIDIFREYISDSEKIEFEDVDKSEVTTTIYPGQDIYMYVDKKMTQYSLGFRCRKLNSDGKYIYGFVTSGHGSALYKPVFYEGKRTKQIGYVVAVSFSSGGKTDASFVRVTEDYNCSNRTFWEDIYVSTGQYDAIPLKNSSVYKVGYNGEEKGIIKSTNASFTADGITIKDVIKATYKSYSGDSGGLVYRIFDGKGYISGIHMGRTVSGSTSYSYFVKMKNIINDLGISLY